MQYSFRGKLICVKSLVACLCSLHEEIASKLESDEGFFPSFETVSLCKQAGLKVSTLPQLPQGWHYRCVPPSLTTTRLFYGFLLCIILVAHYLFSTHLQVYLSVALNITIRSMLLVGACGSSCARLLYTCPDVLDRSYFTYKHCYQLMKKMLQNYLILYFHFRKCLPVKNTGNGKEISMKCNII